MGVTRKKVEHDIQKCYSTWSDSYYEDYYGPEAKYPPVHRDLMIALLKKAKAKSILDAGCGPASFLRDLRKLPLRRFGFDVTSEMVEEAQRVMTKQGDKAENIWKGSVLDSRSYSPPRLKRTLHFDSLVCSGVLPHIREADDVKVFRNIFKALRPGGLAIVEARNQLFSLFTLNRHTQDFFMKDLIGVEDWKKKQPRLRTALSKVEDEVARHFRMDLPPVRKGHAGEPGYDEVLSRTHNPLQVQSQLEKIGFRRVKILYYHFHCAPPLTAKSLGDDFLRKSIRMEDPSDWRGIFMASAFLAVAEK